MTMMTFVAEREAAAKYTGKVELIRRWYERKSSMPMKDAADFTGITTSQFEGILSLIKEHPDWEDAEIADNVNWR